MLVAVRVIHYRIAMRIWYKHLGDKQMNLYIAAIKTDSQITALIVKWI